MTPEQKLKWAILTRIEAWAKKAALPFPCDDVDERYDEASAADVGLGGAEEEVRCGEVETELKTEWNRNYESKAVAMQFPDRSWVGWTYWYGGGKHGDPASIEWMSEAYDLDCVEKEVTVTQRTFTLRTAEG